MSFFRRHPLLIGLFLVASSIIVTLLSLLVLDLYYHHKFSKSAGTNYRGYRGEVLGPKGPNEFRIFVLGGSTAFGYGVGPDETIPAHLERIVQNRISSEGKIVRVINLAYNNESAICFADTIRQYEYLKPDVVMFYSGYNDSPGMTLYRKAKDCFRNKSLMFRTVGYLPILPLVMQEKYYLLRYGNVEEGYKKVQTRNQAQRVPTEFQVEIPPIDRYLVLINNVALYLSNRRLGMIYVTQPYLSKDSYHFRQQEAIRDMFIDYDLYDYFKYVNLGDLFTQGKLKEFAYDGMHLNKEGNKRIAEALAKPVLEMITWIKERETP